MPFKKGFVANPNGRPKRPEIELIRQAIETVGRKKKKDLWIHLVEQAYVDNIVLVALARKLVPDLSKDEVTVQAVRTFLVRPQLENK